MKKAAILIFCLSIFCNYIIAQNSISKKLRTNVFVAQQRTFRSELWLNSDSTYFLSFIGSYEITVNKGFWSKSKDTTILKSAAPNDLNIDFHLASSFKPNVTFEMIFKDMFDMPLQKIEIQLITGTKDTLQVETNDLGIINVKKAVYKKLILPKVDKTFSKYANSEMNLSIMLNEAHNYFELTSNFPSTFFVYSLNVKSFEEDIQKLFWKKHNLLFWKEQQLFYEKDIHLSLYQKHKKL